MFLLNNDCCTSIDKSRKFLSDLTDGKLNISKGMISKLSREFALKTEPSARQPMQTCCFPLLCIQIVQAAGKTEKAVRSMSVPHQTEKHCTSLVRKKEHEGVKGTVTEDYQGILVHDHDITFYNYGADHQECLAHVLRYLKDSMDNEPDRTWNKEMRSLVQEMIHFRNECQSFQEPDPVKVSEFEKRYREILEIARRNTEMFRQTIITETGIIYS